MSDAAQIEAARAKLAARVAPPRDDGPDTNEGKRHREWKPTFLAAFADRGTVTAAARVARVHRATPYEARLTDPDFAAAWDAIEHDVVQLLEQTAFERALDGSDRMLELLLKAHKRAFYGDSMKIDGKLALANEAELDDEISEFFERRAEEAQSAGEGASSGATGLRRVEAPGAPASTPAT